MPSVAHGARAFGALARIRPGAGSLAQNEYAHGPGLIREILGFQGNGGRAGSIFDSVRVQKIGHCRRLQREVHILGKVAARHGDF
jgi:hypothetical protein